MSRRRSIAALAVAAVLAALAPASATTTTDGVRAAGRDLLYDYTPSFIRHGNIVQEYWCGARNSSDPSSYHDSIQYQEYTTSGALMVPVHTVLTNSLDAAAWDGRFACNATVVKGGFVNPLGDGVTYPYAMYYVGTSVVGGTDNQIGAAFSLDGNAWTKYPSPVIAYADPGHGWYGDAQPSAYWTGTQLLLSYELADGGTNTHWQAASSDGVHFAAPARISDAGFASPTPQMIPYTNKIPCWGSIAYSTVDRRWYATICDGWRPAATTGGTAESGDWGITLVSTDDLFAGTWTTLNTYDTGQSGDEVNFLGGILRNPDGTVYSAGQPSVTVEASASNPRIPWNASGSAIGANAAVSHWDVIPFTWSPGDGLRTIIRVHNGSTYYTTTGWFDAIAYPTTDPQTLGGLYEGPTGEATVPVFSCKAFASNYFWTVSPDCQGQLMVGIAGYGYATPAADRIPLYRCEVPGVGSYVDSNPACGGNTSYGLIAYSQG